MYKWRWKIVSSRCVEIAKPDWMIPIVCLLLEHCTWIYTCGCHDIDIDIDAFASNWEPKLSSPVVFRLCCLQVMPSHFTSLANWMRLTKRCFRAISDLLPAVGSQFCESPIQCSQLLDRLKSRDKSFTLYASFLFLFPLPNYKHTTQSVAG